MTTAAPLDARFHALHADGLLLLANCWDAGSARLAQEAGARAVATSSAAVAWSHAWPDGDLLPRELLLQTVRAVAGAVTLPVTVDVEGGFSDDPAAVGELVGAVVEAGAVGINIEDGSAEPALLAAKIAAAREAGKARGVDLFVNARTDVFLRGLAEPGRRVAEVLAREARYREAGASGIFVPGITDAGEIAAVVAGARLPLNVMARPGMMPIAQLRELGVRRYSAGSGISELVNGLVAALMRSFVDEGRIEAPAALEAMGYSELNKVMARG
ncbi:MAG: isocitrate lyase/PEP mutase family protein [Burkholderiaceae bacterium]